jgi:hypothetical protein
MGDVATGGHLSSCGGRAPVVRGEGQHDDERVDIRGLGLVICVDRAHRHRALHTIDWHE